MFCPQCGKEYGEKVNFCCHCGAAMHVPSVAHTKLTRSRRDYKIAGVCGGFAEYFGIDSTLIRLIWLMAAIFGGTGILAYLLAWIIMPEEPEAKPAAASVPVASAPQPASNHS